MTSDKEASEDAERLAKMDPQSRELLLALRRRQGVPYVGKRPIIRKIINDAREKEPSR